MDPEAARTTVYRYEATGPMPLAHPFAMPVPVGIFGGELEIGVVTSWDEAPEAPSCGGSHPAQPPYAAEAVCLQE